MALFKQLVPVSIFLFIFLFSEAHAKGKVPVIHKLPSYFPTCYRNDPELGKCMLEATNQVRPFLAKGIPEFRIPSFEPFLVPEIQLEQGTNAINYKSSLKNVIASGLTNYKFSRFDFDLPNLQFFGDVKISGLRLDGDYTVTGKLLGTPIVGTGKCTIKMDSCDVYVHQKYKEMLKDGKIHLVPVTTNTTFEVKGPKADIKGLFGGNEELGAATTKAINDNFDILIEETKPVLEHTINKVLEDVLFKTLLENVPLDNLIPIKD